MHQGLASWRRVCLDTSTLIYFYNGTEPYFEFMTELMRSIQSGARQAVLSVITELEMLVRPLRYGHTDEVDRLALFFSRLENVELYPVDRAIAHMAAQLRARHRLKVADAIIVATAVEASCDGVVGNDALCAQRLSEIPYLYLAQVVEPGS